MNRPNKRGLPNGIRKCKKGYVAEYNHKELGIYNTVEEAFLAHAIEKKNEIIKVANDYRNIIPNNVYEAVVNCEIDIKYDQNYVA